MEKVYRVEDDFNMEQSVVVAAKEHYNNGNFDMAIKLYKGLLNTNASSKLYLELGLCYYQTKQYDLALEYFTNSTNLDPQNAIAYSYIGNCFFKKLDANNAIKNWMISRSYTPKDDVVALNLAISYFAKNMFYESMFFYEKYLKYAQNKESTKYKSIQKNVAESKKSAQEYFISAQANERRKDIPLAEKNYLLALKKYPISNEYLLNLANLLFASKNYSQAVIYYEMALRESYTDKKTIYKRLSESYEALNNYRLAYCFYQRYLATLISNQQEYLEIIKKMSNLKKYLDSSNSQITLEMAKSHQQNNEYYQALLEYENYLILNPQNNTDVEREISELKRILNPEHAISRSYIKQSKELTIQGQKESANKYYTEVLTLSDPKSSEYKLAKSKLANV